MSTASSWVWHSAWRQASRWRFAFGWLISSAVFAANAGPQLGRPLSAADLTAIPATVFADGRGLPAGSGTTTLGHELYALHCVSCHAPGGVGLTAPALAGAEEPLDSDYPDQTIGSFWPYAPVLFDFIQRAKPMSAPGTFTATELYALTAYLLVLNNLIDLGDSSPFDAEMLQSIEMPNRGGFRPLEASP